MAGRVASQGRAPAAASQSQTPTAALLWLLPPMILRLVLMFAPPFATACDNMEIKDIKMRACSPDSLMRNYAVKGTLKEDCTLEVTACFNLTRIVNCTQAKFKFVKKPFVNKESTMDWCKEVDKLCADEEENVGISCAATRKAAANANRAAGNRGGGGGRQVAVGGGGNRGGNQNRGNRNAGAARGGGGGSGSAGQRNNQQQQKQQKRNKYAPMQCPMRAGRRCITHSFNVTELKKYKKYMLGIFTFTATLDHCAAGQSCANGTFTIGEKKQAGQGG